MINHHGLFSLSYLPWDEIVNERVIVGVCIQDVLVHFCCLAAAAVVTGAVVEENRLQLDKRVTVAVVENEEVKTEGTKRRRADMVIDVVVVDVDDDDIR